MSEGIAPPNPCRPRSSKSSRAERAKLQCEDFARRRFDAKIAKDREREVAP